jgi:hypothetical protein
VRAGEDDTTGPVRVQSGVSLASLHDQSGINPRELFRQVLRQDAPDLIVLLTFLQHGRDGIRPLDIQWNTGRARFLISHRPLLSRKLRVFTKGGFLVHLSRKERR